MSDNFEKHKATIDEIYEATKDEQWTMPVATLVLLLGGILLVTIIVNIVFFSFPNLFVALPVYLVEIGALLFILNRYRQKVYLAAREKVAALETAQPGITNAFQERHAKAASKKS